MSSTVAVRLHLGPSVWLHFFNTPSGFEKCVCVCTCVKGSENYTTWDDEMGEGCGFNRKHIIIDRSEITLTLKTSNATFC